MPNKPLEPKHTPTPWKTGRPILTHNFPVRHWACEVLDEKNENVATAWGESQQEAEANAAYIVEACTPNPTLKKQNEELREALRLVTGVCQSDLETHFGQRIGKKIRAALAEGER